jgi:hypothetical protein
MAARRSHVDLEGSFGSSGYDSSLLVLSQLILTQVIWLKKKKWHGSHVEGAAGGSSSHCLSLLVLNPLILDTGNLIKSFCI